MTRLEMVEKIREKTGVSYDAAKEALENSDWDMLDALIALDRQDFSAAREKNTASEEQKRVVKKRSVNIGEAGTRFLTLLKYVLKVISKGETIRLEISKKDEFVESISLTALILLLLLIWWVPVLLIAIGLFTGFKFRFSGAGRLVNVIAEKTGEKAEEIKSIISEKN